MNSITVRREKSNLGHNNAHLLIKKAIKMVLSSEKIEYDCIVSVLLTDDEGIRAMNREYRNVDSVTDVLSFPMNELTAGNFQAIDCTIDPETGSVLLGDIMINLNRCQEQGEEFGHGFDREIIYLTVHSMLHLLGYDHIDEGEMKKQMRTREKAIMGDE